jgi:hypothetical protein
VQIYSLLGINLCDSPKKAEILMPGARIANETLCARKKLFLFESPQTNRVSMKETTNVMAAGKTSPLFPLPLNEKISFLPVNCN